jgi:hypothetical protein
MPVCNICKRKITWPRMVTVGLCDRDECRDERERRDEQWRQDKLRKRGSV